MVTGALSCLSDRRFTYFIIQILLVSKICIPLLTRIRCFEVDDGWCFIFNISEITQDVPEAGASPEALGWGGGGG